MLVFMFLIIPGEVRCDEHWIWGDMVLCHLVVVGKMTIAKSTFFQRTNDAHGGTKGGIQKLVFKVDYEF